MIAFALVVGLFAGESVYAAKKKKKERDPFEASTGGVFLFSTEAEKKLGQDVKQEVLKQYKLYENKELVDYVRGVGAKLASFADRQNVTYEFYVLDDPLVNAFALPGGTIYITRGILTMFNNEAELACVLGHEITHVVERHSMKHLQGQQLIGITLKVLAKGEDIPLWQQIGADLLLFKPYGRGDELRSDAVGMKYAYMAGYQANAGVRVFEEFQKRDDFPLPAFFRSHPVDAARIKQINELWALIQTREDIKPSTTPLVMRAEEYEKIVGPHTYRVHYPDVRAAYEQLCAAVSKKDIEGALKVVDKEFKSRWLKMNREGFKKYFEERFAAYEQVALSAAFREFRFMDKDLIGALCDVSETLVLAGGKTDSATVAETLYFVKRGAGDGPPWRLAGIEDTKKW